MGRKVLLLEAPPENIKVTTPLDLRVAELLLAERRAATPR
jgi:2-C-methyl-D-erythritol 4-phosphate cytidylyltransferase